MAWGLQWRINVSGKRGDDIQDGVAPPVVPHLIRHSVASLKIAAVSETASEFSGSARSFSLFRYFVLNGELQYSLRLFRLGSKLILGQNHFMRRNEV